jgi:small subunit ribosomal protein S6
MKTRRYETLVLMNPDLTDDEFEQLKQKLTDIIDRMEGRMIREDDWGRRRLAYPIKKQVYGRYYLMDYMGLPALMTELERNMGIDEQVFKFLTLVLDKNFTDEKFEHEVERIKAEKARVEAERAQREAERAQREAEMAEAAAREEEEASRAEEPSGDEEESDDESGSDDDDDDSEDSDEEDD